MELNRYHKKIIVQLQKNISFSESDLVKMEILKSCDNIQEQINVLNELMEQGDIQKIKDFPCQETNTTYDDYTYLLVKLKDKSILISVWDSDELWDDPTIVKVKEL